MIYDIFKRFFANLKINLIIYLQNIKYPKRYLLKVRHLQRPLIFLKFRRLIFSLFNPSFFQINKSFFIKSTI